MKTWLIAGMMCLGVSFVEPVRADDTPVTTEPTGGVANTQATVKSDEIPDISNTEGVTATVKVEEKTGPMVLSTFHQQSTGKAIYAENLPLKHVQLPLHDQIWLETFNNAPIDVIGETLTITSITVPDLGEALTDRVGSLSILDADGEVIATSGAGVRSTSATLKLLSEKATYVMAYETTFTFTTKLNSTDPVTLECHSQNHDLLYFLRFNPKEGYTGAVNIPVFKNHDTTRKDADETYLRVTDEVETAPYLKITGTATFDKVTAELTNAGTFSLKTIIDKATALHGNNDDGTEHKVDDFHHLIVLRAQTPDVIVQMDTALSKAEVVVATNTEKSTYTDNEVTIRAATLRFMAPTTTYPTTAFTGALSVRDISKNANGEDIEPDKGFVRFEYVNASGTPELVIPKEVFSPFSFTQTCDVELASYPEKAPEGDTTGAHWFWRNPFKVPSGRTLRLVTCTEKDLETLPNVAFTDATSILDLAFDNGKDGTYTAHEMAEAVGQVIDSSSGTLEVHSETFSHEGTTVSMGTETGAIYGMPTEQTIHTYNDFTINGSFVIANGQGTMADIIQYTGITTVGRTSTETTTYNDIFRFGRGSTTDGTTMGAARAIYEMKAGELNVPGTLLFSNRVQVGRLTIGDGEGAANTAVAEIGTLLSQPKTITSGTPALDESLAADASGIATVEVKSDGHLKLGNKELNFIPPSKSFFYLEGGTLEAMTNEATFNFGEDTTEGGGLRLRGNTTSTIIGGEGTSTTTNGTTVYEPGLTIDAVTGDGNLQLSGSVTIGELRDFRGKVEVKDQSENSTDAGIISKISGARSVITFGNLGDNGTMGVANILTMADACGYRGSIGFDATVYPDIDVESVPIETLGHAIRVENGQELTIRLDQLADTIIVWPETINNVTLTLVEAGAYGGRLQLPHIPEKVKVNFEYYNDAGGRDVHTEGTWKITPEESGATDILSWEEPHVGGKGTWIDIEFDGDSYNTGWMTLGGTATNKNGALQGLNANDGQGNSNYMALMTTVPGFFTDTYNPKGEGVYLYSRPYIDVLTFNDDGSMKQWGLTYPEVWSASVRIIPPKVGNKTILALGSMIRPAVRGGAAHSLVLATGATKTDLVLWHIKQNPADSVVIKDASGNFLPEVIEQVASAKIADRDDIMHVVSVTCDGKQLIVYLNGRELVQYPLPTGFPGLGTGLQCGQLLDDGSNHDDILAALKGVESGEGGVVDYIRFYKGVLTPEAMAALSEESPAIDRATRYIRELKANSPTIDGKHLWVDDTNKPWIRETWSDNGTSGSWTRETATFAEPTEGAEVRVICHGDYTLEVNTVEERDKGFLSRDRSYSLFCVTPPDNVNANATDNTYQLTLVPIGGAITSREPLTGESAEEVLAWETNATDSIWLNLKDTNGDYQYGTLYFQGGANDLVHPELAMVVYSSKEHTLWLRNGDNGTITPGTFGNTTTKMSDAIDEEPSGWINIKYTRTRTLTQTRTDTMTLNATGSVVTLRASAGVCGLQEQTAIMVDAVTTTKTRTVTRSLTQTASITRSRRQDAPSTSDWNSATWEPTLTEADTWTDDEATAAWLAPENTATTHKNTLQMMADYSLVRGATDKESAIHVLTGPVEGEGITVGNTAIDEGTNQVSDHVWVPKFTEGDEWHVSDVTETYYGTGSNPDGKVSGLIARVLQVPGRLYLDLGQQDLILTNGKALFSKQNWHRYGYIGTTSAETGITAYPIYTNNEDGTLTYTDAGKRDFNMAIAFQIKTKAGEAKTLVLDATKTEVTTLRVDLPSSYTTVPTLVLENSTYTEEVTTKDPTTNEETTTTTTKSHNFTITGQVITFARLEDLQGALTIQEGALIHGHTTGTYAFKNHTPSHLIKDTTVANLEAHGKLNDFGGSVELHNTNLILADDATFYQSNPDAHLWMKSLTLGNGATFRFEARGADAEENGVVFLDRVTLTGTAATLCGGGELGSDETAANIDLASHFTAEGFTAEQAKTILTVKSEPLESNTNSTVPNRWICYTADFQTGVDADGKSLGGFGLTKKGAGTMAFRDTNPPSLSGPVRVEEGILRVGGKAPASDALIHDKNLTNAIGHYGLYVAKGATLATNRLTPTDYVLACLESGKELSGTGTIDGDVRLCSGAIVNGTDGIGMTLRRFVLDGSASSDVTVKLPSGVKCGDTIFYLTEDSVRTETRRRFKAMNGNVRWDVVGEHKATTNTTATWAARYYVEDPYLPVPESPTTNTPANPNTYATGVESTFILYYQSYGVANILETKGVTKGGEYSLNASEIGNAFQCFSNVWTFGEPKDTNLVDMRHLLMAYEFGISRESIREIATVGEGGTSTMQEYVVVEVTLLNTLQKQFGSESTAKAYNDLPGAETVADFQLGTQVVIRNVVSNVEMPTFELKSFDATDLTAPTDVTRTPGRRFYAIPFTDTNFPMGATTFLRAEALTSAGNNQ